MFFSGGEKIIPPQEGDTGFVNILSSFFQFSGGFVGLCSSHADMGGIKSEIFGGTFFAGIIFVIFGVNFFLLLLLLLMLLLSLSLLLLMLLLLLLLLFASATFCSFSVFLLLCCIGLSFCFYIYFAVVAA